MFQAVPTSRSDLVETGLHESVFCFGLVFVHMIPVRDEHSSWRNINVAEGGGGDP